MSNKGIDRIISKYKFVFKGKLSMNLPVPSDIEKKTGVCKCGCGLTVYGEKGTN